MTYRAHISTLNNLYAAAQNYMRSQKKLTRFEELIFKNTHYHIKNETEVHLPCLAHNTLKVARMLDEPNYGLMIGSQFKLDDFNLYQKHQQHLKELHIDNEIIHPAILINIALRYLEYFCEPIDIDMRFYQGHYSIELFPSESSGGNVSYHEFDAAIAIIIRFTNMYCSAKATKLLVQRGGDDSVKKVYKKKVGVTPELGNNRNIVGFQVIGDSSVQLEQIINLYRKNERLLDEYQQELSFDERCRQVIKQTIPLGEPKRKLIASIFNISISTLQRRLKESNYTFQDLLLDVRLEKVRHYIDDTNISVQQIGKLLAYKDAAQFSRAFKQWFGVSPLHYRQQLAEETSVSETSNSAA